MRIAAFADLHCRIDSQGCLRPLLERAAAESDVIALCGDLTDHGTAEETRVLVGELVTDRVPVLAVLGNHDFEANQERTVFRILAESGVHVLDGEGYEIGDVGFAGVKGFGGGFDDHVLEPWGEDPIKLFVRVAMDEAMKLETGLARLPTTKRVALLHYSPIASTVKGEPMEIYPFVGSSRLEEPLNRYHVDLVLHGHAHSGSPEGRTREGARVYNVAAPLLRRLFPDQPPYRIVEV